MKVNVDALLAKARKISEIGKQSRYVFDDNRHAIKYMEQNGPWHVRYAPGVSKTLILENDNGDKMWIHSHPHDSYMELTK